MAKPFSIKAAQQNSSQLSKSFCFGFMASLASFGQWEFVFNFDQRIQSPYTIVVDSGTHKVYMAYAIRPTDGISGNRVHIETIPGR